MESLPLTPDVLVAAYVNGIFPMDVNGTIRWFNPDPRAVIEPDTFHISRSLRHVWRRNLFEIRIDTCFERVMRLCGDRSGGTWISDEIVAGYTRLHERGLAHSVETWRDNELAGGLYGVALGGAFFAESKFHRRTNASKIALVALVERMRDRGFTLLDVQFLTPHLEQFGTIEIRRAEYMRRLKDALTIQTRFVD